MSTVLEFKRLKHVGARGSMIAFGYIREIEHTLSDTFKIPIEIKNLCLLFYFPYWEWNGDDVVNWIVSLDEENYNRYRETLSKRILEEGIDGGCLEDLEFNDLDRIGISLLKHRGAIYLAIQQLIGYVASFKLK